MFCISALPNREIIQRLPYWLSGQESACQCREDRFNYWSGRSPYATEWLSLCSPLLSPCSRACRLQLLKPTCLEPVLCNKRSHHREKPAHVNEEQPLTATRERLRTVTKTQCSQKFMNKINYFLRRFLSLLLQQK